MDKPAYTAVIQLGVERRRHMPLKAEHTEKLDQLLTLRRGYESLIQGYIEAGIDDGSIRPLPVRLAMRTIVGGVLSINNWYQIDDLQETGDKDEMARDVADVLLESVGSSTPS